MIGLRSIGEMQSGGVERAVREISLRLAKLDVDVTVYCRAKYNDLGAMYGGVRLVDLPAIYTKHLEAITHTLIAAISAGGKYDIVHFHALGPSLLSFFPKVFGGKSVVTVHGLDWKREKWGYYAGKALRAGEYAAATFPSRTIVVSKFLKKYFSMRYSKDVEYIPNGFETTAKIPLSESTAAKFNVQPGEYILSLGRIVPEKGLHYLIRGYIDSGRDEKLVIAGDYTHARDYHDHLKTLAAGNRKIIFTGGVFGGEKNELISNAAMFVLPSTIEGLPIALLEAMGTGVPVLCSDIPENMEVISADYDWTGAASENAGAAVHDFGVSFVVKNPASLADGIKIIAENKQLADKLASNGKLRVASEYGWDGIAERTLKVYKSAI